MVELEYFGAPGAEGTDAGCRYEVGLQPEAPTPLIALYLKRYVLEKTKPFIVYAVARVRLLVLPMTSKKPVPSLEVL